MGLCVSYDELIVSHKGENKLREIIRAFKSRSYSIEKLAMIILEQTEQSDRQNFYYEYILNTYNNPYFDINEAIINIPNNVNIMTNEQFMLVKLIPLAQSSNTKVYFVKEYFGINSLKRLLEICDVMWRNVLIKYNEVMLEKINDMNEIQDKNSMNEIVREVFNQENYAKFYEEIENQWILVLNRESEDKLEECDEFWEYLKNKFDFCFNAIELRHFFYLKFYGR